MIDFKILNKTGLEEFINSHEFNQVKSLPITKHRAISHINNPRADKDDALLIVACLDCEIVGYIGILPDLLFSSEGRSYKCGNLSCLWVDPALRGKGIGDQLLKKSIELYDNKVYLTEFVPDTKKIYYKTGAFVDPIVRNGIKLYIRMDLHTILPPRNRIFRNIKGLLKLSDGLFNSILDLRFLFFRKELPPVKLEYTNQIDEETGKFISKFQDRQLFRRGVAELNWIVQYPWILSSLIKDSDNQRYYFSSIDKSFNFYCLKVRNNLDELVAFLMFSKRNNILKLPYCYIEKEVIHQVASIIEFHILKWRINSFTTYNARLADYFLANKTIGIFKKKMERQYLITNVLGDIIKDFSYDIQDGDADCAFT